MEKTLVLVKPDGVQRGLIGEVIARLERRGLRLVAAKFMQVSEELAAAHYSEHVGKPFYPTLISYITSAPVMAMAWEGKNAVAAVRQTLGLEAAGLGVEALVQLPAPRIRHRLGAGGLRVPGVGSTLSHETSSTLESCSTCLGVSVTGSANPPGSVHQRSRCLPLDKLG